MGLRRILFGTTLTLALSLAPEIACAQFSPNCERNGRRDYCAVTLDGEGPNGQAVARVTFADHTVYRLVRNEASCKAQSQQVRTCHAKIITPPDHSVAIAAFYRGTAYEGGYRHDYIGRGIQITFTFLD